MRRKLWIISLVVGVTLDTLPACGGDQGLEEEDGREQTQQVALLPA